VIHGHQPIKSGRSREAFYRELLNEQAGSGLNARAFAKSKGIKPATFYGGSKGLRALAEFEPQERQGVRPAPGVSGRVSRPISTRAP